ncbi:MAG: tetratricopeptide repeat protein [Anaerolineae bacterium]
MELPDSYEALYEQAERTAITDLLAAAEQFRRLVDRLLSLPPRILDRKPNLRDLLNRAADDYLVLLRWTGQNEKALAEVERLSQALPQQAEFWTRERALNLIDSGRVSEGLDLLRALLLQHPADEYYVRDVLARALWGVGEYAEATELARMQFQDASDEDERLAALALLISIAMEEGDPKGVVSYAQKINEQTGHVPFWACEWLAGRGRWDDLEELLKRVSGRFVRRVFRGEIRRARGDEAGARAQWEPLLDEERSGDADLYSYVAVRLLTQQADEALEYLVKSALAEQPEDPVLALALVAALAQMGRVDEAVAAVQDYLDAGRPILPYRNRLPYSHWLRLRRYPMPDEAVEALRPYFVTEQTAAPA